MPGLGQELENEFTKEEIRYYQQKYKEKEVANLCKKNGIISIGWILNPVDTWLNHTNITINREKFKELYENTPWYAENKKKLNSSIKNFQELKEGDFCWVRDSSDKYYVCKIEGDWHYDSSKKAWAMNIAQRYKCKWVEVGDVTETPAAVVKKLIMRGRTVSKIDDECLLNMSKYLFERGGRKEIEKAINEFDNNNYIGKDILSNLTAYDYEDFVGFYLQSEGYFIMPSTRYQSTEGYEFVAIKKDSGERIAVQVKQQKEKLKGKDYERLSNTYTVYLACSSGVDMEGADKNGIKEISNTDLEKFIKENRGLLLGRVKFWVVYQKYQQQGNQ